MNKKFKVIISAKKAGKNGSADKTIDLVQGEVVHIAAQGGERYQLHDVTAGVSPKKVSIKRVGAHLYIVLEGSSQPDIIIDNYFDETQPANSLQGVSEDGNVFDYTISYSQDSLAQDTLNQAAGDVSGGGLIDTLSDYAWALGIGLAAGGGAAAMGMGGGGKKTPKGTPATPKKSPVINQNIEDDTGYNQSDAVTANNQPKIQIAKLSKGITALLMVDGQLVEATQTMNSKGVVYLTPTNALSDGTHYIAYRLKNAAGKVGGNSPLLTVVIDSTAPLAPIDAPDMTAVSDTGASDSDNITTNTKPEFNIGGVSKTTKAQLMVDGNVVASTVRGPDENGHYFLTPTALLSTGIHNVSYRYEDVAGNVSVNSPALTMTVGEARLVDPVTPPDMTAESDTGRNQTDNITSNTKPVFNVGALSFGVVAQLVLDGRVVDAKVSVDAQGNTLLSPVDALAIGDHYVTYQLKNETTGKTSQASPRLDIVIGDDNTYTLSLDAINNDTGVSDSDLITRENAIVFIGRTNAPKGTFVGIELTDAYDVKHFIGLVSVLGDGSGTWRFAYSKATNLIDSSKDILPDGSYSIDYYIIDAKGNRLSAAKAAMPPKELIVDSSQAKNYFSPPQDDPNYLNAAIAITGISSDTGVSDDAITSDKTVVVSGTVTNFTSTGEGRGDCVSVQILDDKNTVVAQAAVMPAEGTGAWSLSHELSALVDGKYTVKAAIIDLAGNEVKVAPVKVLIIDATAPGKNTNGTDALIKQPTVIIPEATDGISDKEVVNGIQSSITLPTHTQEGDTLSLVVTNPSGSEQIIDYHVTNTDAQKGVIDVTIPLSALGAKGDYNVTATVSDLAGNKSARSSATSFVLLNNAPSFLTFSPIAGDGFLNLAESQQSLTVSGLTNAPVGTLVTITTQEEGTEYNTQVQAGATHRSSNTFAITIVSHEVAKFSQGEYQFTASLTDVFGRTTTDVTILTVDTIAPNAPATAPNAPENADGKINFTDMADGTVVNVSLVDTKAVAGDNVHVMIDGITTDYTLTVNDIANQVANVTIPKSVLDAAGQGAAKITATISDAAGNMSAVSPQTIVQLDTFSGAMTKIIGTIVAGPVVAGNDLTVAAFRADGTQIGSAVAVNSDGSYAITFTENYIGMVLVRVIDMSDTIGDYIDEATLVSKDLNSDLRAVIYIDGTGIYSINVNVLTETTVRVLGLAGGDKGTSSTLLNTLTQG